MRTDVVQFLGKSRYAFLMIRKRNFIANGIINDNTLSASVKTQYRDIIGDWFKNDMRSTFKHTSKEEKILFPDETKQELTDWLKQVR